MPELSASEVSLRIGGVHILRSVGIELDRSGIVGLVGPNGAGKTTLFNVICGLVRPSRGTVTLEGHDVTSLPPHARAAMGLGRTFQNLQLYDEMTVLDNVMVGRAKTFPRGLGGALVAAVAGGTWPAEREARQKAYATLDMLGIADDARRPVAELPFGRRRLVDLARALCGEPSVVLLDEPFSGLTSQEKSAMAETVADVRQKRDVALMLVEHDMDVISSFCSTVTVLDSGEVIAAGQPQEVLEMDAVKEAYLGRELTRLSRGDNR
ncbi:MAG: ABC transporter ATP-binding protein [Actinomycetota bacterium]